MFLEMKKNKKKFSRKSNRKKLPKYSRSNNTIMKTIIERHDGKKARAVFVLAAKCAQKQKLKQVE